MLKDHLEQFKGRQFNAYEILDHILNFLEIGLKHMQDDNEVRNVLY